MEHKRDEIVKALECFHHRILNTNLATKITEGEMIAIIDALSLINELTEEKERLEASIKILVANNADLETELAITYDLLEETKADTVRKMQKEIEARCIKGGIYPAFVKSTINQIAKEMIGEVNKERSEE